MPLELLAVLLLLVKDALFMVVGGLISRRVSSAGSSSYFGVSLVDVGKWW